MGSHCLPSSEDHYLLLKFLPALSWEGMFGVGWKIKEFILSLTPTGPWAGPTISLCLHLLLCTLGTALNPASSIGLSKHAVGFSVNQAL